MQKFVIAVSLAAIVGIAYELSRVDGADTRYESFDVDTSNTAPGNKPVQASTQAAPAASDDSVIWLDTVVVVAPRLEPEEKTPVGEQLRAEAPVRAAAEAGFGDDVDRVVPIKIVSAPDRVEATPDRVAKARGKMSPDLRGLAAAGGYEMVDVIVSLRTRPDEFESGVLESVGGVVMRRYESLNMRAVRVPAAALDRIAAEYNVKSLTLDSQLTATPVSATQAALLP